MCVSIYDSCGYSNISQKCGKGNRENVLENEL